MPTPCTHAVHPRLMHLVAGAATLLLALSLSGTALADAADANVPPPRDTPYIGTLTIHVDATDTQQGIFRITETIPVKPGEMTLLYPKWIPGVHAFNPHALEKFAGLVISANGKRIPWTRDKYDVYAFNLNVPQGTSKIHVAFQWLAARTEAQGSILMTNRILDLKWCNMALYPAGYYTRDIPITATVTFPEGWKFATALETKSHDGNTWHFKTVPFNTLIDSPVYAGKYYRRLDLNPGGDIPVHMDLFAAAPKYLEVKPQELKMLRALVQQGYKLWDSHHYDHYDFLVSVSDVFAHNGMEHHRSSEDGVDADFFTSWEPAKDGEPARPFGAALFAHEWTHSWNGKFMRPADLWTPNYNVPMGDSKLWVYEGETQYWGKVLPVRAGMRSPKQFREWLAVLAARFDRGLPGLQWRNIQDTTNDEMIAHRRPRPYHSWQMGELYYNGGLLIWLGVDAKIRALTNGRKSLDTFARQFYGVDNGSWVTHTYTFDDVVAALNHVVKYDWAHFLRKRLDQHKPPLGSIRASGWKLVYTDKPNKLEKRLMKKLHRHNFELSIGMAVGKEGKIRDVRWNGPAFKAGIGSGETVVAVNGLAYSAKVLKHAIKTAEKTKTPIKLLLKYQNHFQTIPVAYYGGPQYPHLVRVQGAPDYLSRIIAPK